MKSFPPDTGFVDQVGEGEGEGNTVNIPFPAGTGNAAYLKIKKTYYPK
ncbi:hypothetical protein [Pseudogracilibacillus sp. SE30717A]